MRRLNQRPGSSDVVVTSHPLQATGVTVFRITRGMDAGPVVAQCGTSIEPHETAGDLLSRLAESGSSVLVRAMQAVDAGRVSVCCCAVSGVLSVHAFLLERHGYDSLVIES